MSKFDDLMSSSQNMTIESVKESLADETFEREFWTPKADDSGRANVKIRFLPDPNGKQNWVHYYDRFYKNAAGRVLAEKCRTSMRGEADPIQEYANILYDRAQKGDSDAEQLYRELKRKKRYVANVLILDDGRGEDGDNGKIVKYRFGAQIFAKIKNAMSPEFDDDEIIFPFSLDEKGADFNIRQKMKERYPNFEDSKFLEKKALKEVDTLKEALEVTDLADLSEYLNPETFKSYDELKALLKSIVLNQNSEDEVAGFTLEDSEPEVDKEPHKEEAHTDQTQNEKSSLEDDDEFLKSLVG